ncbi:unnamed protein product [Gongylonema pulchrum]|uniref:protein-serine/threonine phosphatase n=1 Tax=Gongylonema pulchrum TaxID=637853 RepID=A0A3P6S0Q4_9BILA|nr:unnamed protein product [Gongylonema pulchrum]
MRDILWSEPNRRNRNGWGEDRGTARTFGADVVEHFLKRHAFDLICRSHQVFSVVRAFRFMLLLDYY